jgi:hypothetical protein
MARRLWRRLDYRWVHLHYPLAAPGSHCGVVGVLVFSQAKSGYGIARGYEIVVPEGNPAVSEVSDLEQPTAFDSWLQYFDQASIPKDGFLEDLAEWAYPRYQRYKDTPRGTIWLIIKWQMITWALRIVYFSVTSPSKAGLGTSPSTDELIENAFTQSLEGEERSEETHETQPRRIESTSDVSMPAQSALSASANDGMEGTRIGASPPELAEEFSEEQTHLFLTQLSGSVKTAADAAEKDAQIIRSREKMLFRMFVVAAVITFLFAAAGVVLIFSGYLAVGVVSAAVAVLPGSGTAILRGMATQQQAARAARAATADDDRRVWQAVQAAMMIPDSQERNAAMADLAKTFARRIST